MPWFVEPDFAASWKSNLGQQSPASLLDFRTLNALFRKRLHLRREVIAHEVQLRSRTLGGVYRSLGWGQTEDQPSATRINVLPMVIYTEFTLEANIAVAAALSFVLGAVTWVVLAVARTAAGGTVAAAG